MVRQEGDTEEGGEKQILPAIHDWYILYLSVYPF